MKTTALLLLAAILAGCAHIVPDPSPTPPGMPLDPEYIPDADSRAITRVDAGIPSPF